MTMKRTAYPSATRYDPEMADRMKWVKACLGHTVGDHRVSASVILRRALAVYQLHLEGILNNKGEARPRLLQYEGHAIHYHTSEHGVPWADGVFPQGELEAEAFPKFSEMLKRHQALRPKLSTLLEAEVEAMEAGASPARFMRRSD